MSDRVYTVRKMTSAPLILDLTITDPVDRRTLIRAPFFDRRCFDLMSFLICLLLTFDLPTFDLLTLDLLTFDLLG